MVVNIKKYLILSRQLGLTKESLDSEIFFWAAEAFIQFTKVWLLVSKLHFLGQNL